MAGSLGGELQTVDLVEETDQFAEVPRRRAVARDGRRPPAPRSSWRGRSCRTGRSARPGSIRRARPAGRAATDWNRRGRRPELVSSRASGLPAMSSPEPGPPAAGGRGRASAGTARVIGWRSCHGSGPRLGRGGTSPGEAASFTTGLGGSLAWRRARSGGRSDRCPSSW